MLAPEIALEIAQHVYDLRASVSRTQAEFAAFVAVEPSVIADIEESWYEGNAFEVLKQIEKEVRRHVHACILPGKTVYPNALLGTTVSGFQLTLFRYHPGRRAVHSPPGISIAELKTAADIQHIRNELYAWCRGFRRNRQELKMFACAGITEWCHLSGGLRVNLSGTPDEYIHAVDMHTQLVKAVIHYFDRGERTAFKQWRQDMGVQEETRYLAELENALQEKTFEEFPDAEWLVQALVKFVKQTP